MIDEASIEIEVAPLESGLDLVPPTAELVDVFLWEEVEIFLEVD